MFARARMCALGSSNPSVMHAWLKILREHIFQSLLCFSCLRNYLPFGLNVNRNVCLYWALSANVLAIFNDFEFCYCKWRVISWDVDIFLIPKHCQYIMAEFVVVVKSCFFLIFMMTVSIIFRLDFFTVSGALI